MFLECLYGNWCIEESNGNIDPTHPLFSNQSLKKLVNGHRFQKIDSTDLSQLQSDNASYACVVLKNGTIYKGAIKNQKANDINCLIIFSDGSSYQGNIKDGIIQGTGVYVFADNTYNYDGEWKDGLPDGNGVQISPTGKYIGIFIKGKKQGNGALTFPDGSTYIGCFLNNEIQGKGIYHSKNYFAKGSWKNGYLEGQGIQHYADGSQYVGNFKKGKPNGQGVFTLSSNKVYRGVFENGKPVGRGFYYENNKVYQKDWNNDNTMSLSITIPSLMARSSDSRSLLKSDLSKLSSRDSKRGNLNR